MAETSLNATASDAAGPAAGPLRFGGFTLDLARAELLRHGREVPLRPKTFALLAYLARNPSRVLSKQELLDAVWPGLVVTEDSLTQCIHDLRTALGDAGAHLVRTVARRGYRFDADIEDATAASRPRPHSVMRRPAAALAGMAAVLLAAAGLFAVLRPVPSPLEARPLSIVVLPLAGDAVNATDDWFSQAMTRDLTLELGQVSGTLVISRDTASTYKGKVDPRRVASELGVRYVVTGGFRRDGDRVQLDLSMVDGSSGAQQWTQRFDIERTRLGETISDIARQVARSLSVQMLRAGGERAAALRPEQVQADDLAMQGWSVYFRGVSRENLSEAGRLFEASVARDPSCIRGWGGVAVVNGLLLGNLWTPDRQAAMVRLEQARTRLHELDQNDIHAYFAKYFIALIKSEYEDLLAISTEMIERFPSNPQPHFGVGVALMNLGRFEECVEPSKRAIRLGPRDPAAAVWHRQIGTCHFFRGEYREAAEYARTAQQLNPNVALAPLLLAASLGRLGETGEARAVVAAILKRNPEAKAADVEGILRVNRNQRYLEARQRWIDTLRELGLP